jgi:hypothetical protein
VTHSGLAERAVIRYQSARDVIRDRPDEPAHDLHTEAGRATNERLGAFPRHDLCNLTALGY